MSERFQPYVGVSGAVTYKNIQLSGLVVTEPQALWVQSYTERAGLFDKNRWIGFWRKHTQLMR